MERKRVPKLKRKAQEDKNQECVERRPPTRVQRKAGSAEVKLNAILERVAQQLMQESRFFPFIQPAADVARDYLQYVQQPMDLNTMRAKAARWQYRSRAEFEADLELIVSNCHTYNTQRGQNLSLEPAARELQERGVASLAANAEALANIEDQLVSDEQDYKQQQQQWLLARLRKGMGPAQP